ncbi:MAG: hypothetical protein ACK5V3_06435 [Bdellovibrionales bacterium]
MATSLMAVAWMGVGHHISFKPTLVNSITSGDKWTVSQILSPDCRCSNLVLKSLLSRRAQADINERIIWMAEQPPLEREQLNKLGFDLVLTASIEDKNEIEGVPTLAISNEKGQNLYVGGYSHSKLTNVNQVKDIEIVHGLKGQGPLTEFPVFGCATSQKFRKYLNPFAQK